MPKLAVQTNGLDYVGTYSRPAFSLWGQGAKVVSGLYDAFTPMGVSLSQISSKSGGDGVASESVNVLLGKRGIFQFRFDRVAVSKKDFTDAELIDFPSVAKAGIDWLLRAAPETEFESHTFSYAGHAEILGSDSREYLSSLLYPDLEVGHDLGSGIIFHREIPIRSAKMELTVDHSKVIEGGLFLSFVVDIERGFLDYRDSIDYWLSTLNASLNAIDLQFDRQLRSVE